MAERDWNDHYATGETPWDVGVPDEHLVRFAEGRRAPPGRALEVGCGTGTNALWLASRGWRVTAIDLSPLALERARAKAPPGATCTFARLDFLAETPAGGPFDLVFDRGCFHVFDEAAERRRFADRVAALLAPGGLWLCLAGSTEGPARSEGPPRRSARELIHAGEPALELLELQRAEFAATLSRPEAPAAWRALWRRREVPAQPSTGSG